jgi:hypothetical protein
MHINLFMLPSEAGIFACMIHTRNASQGETKYHYEHYNYNNLVLLLLLMIIFN